MIEIKNIQKKYGDVFAVDNLSLGINRGEIIGLLGPNGAGKSTLMKMVNGIIKQDKGTISIDGMDVFSNLDITKSKIGYLPENNPLYEYMYVVEYLDFVADVYKVNKSRIEEVIEKTGLDKVKSKKVRELSKGYKQRLGLAAAFIHEPDFLILDEPTTGLDPNQIDEIRNLIKEYGRDHSIVLSTHIMQEVEAICNRVVLINKGNIIADKSIEEFSVSNKNTFRIEFEKEIDTAVFDSLNYEKIQYISSNTFKIEAKSKDVLEDVLKIAKSQSNVITHYSVYKESLEEVFKTMISK
jgi:ABC-2 type transport system ATP-binding protein